MSLDIKTTVELHKLGKRLLKKQLVIILDKWRLKFNGKVICANNNGFRFQLNIKNILNEEFDPDKLDDA